MSPAKKAARSLSMFLATETSFLPAGQTPAAVATGMQVTASTAAQLFDPQRSQLVLGGHGLPAGNPVTIIKEDPEASSSYVNIMDDENTDTKPEFSIVNTDSQIPGMKKEILNQVETASMSAIVTNENTPLALSPSYRCGPTCSRYKLPSHNPSATSCDCPRSVLKTEVKGESELQQHNQ